MAKSASPSPDAGRKVVAENRKARHNYHILETFEAGLSLVGTEVKSLRSGGCNIAEAYVDVKDNEAFIRGMNIAPYDQGNRFNHEPLRERRLLLHRKQIEELHGHIAKKGNTIVPLTVYFTRGKAKLAIGIARGKQNIDRRQDIAKRDAARQIAREHKLHLR